MSSLAEVGARAEAEKIVSSLARIGRRLVGYCSATGRVLLADLPDDKLDTYLEQLDPKPLTRHTVTDKGRLREVILKVREERVAITDEELEDGMAALAVPVVDRDGKTIAGVSVRTERWHFAEFFGAGAGRMLLDPIADPHELHNLADDPQYADVVAELSQLARTYAGRH